MTNQDAATWPDLLVIKEFLDPLLCRRIVAEMNAAQAEAATVYSHTVSDYVDQNMRQTLRIRPSTETIELITNRLRAHQQTIEKHFAVSLSECEDPQFLRYRVGDFFVAHQDGNTGLLRLDTERRRISLVIFLSRESELPEADAYCGGSLILSDLRSDRKVHLMGAPGKLVVFRAETTHEVTPVTHGERYSIVSWFR